MTRLTLEIAIGWLAAAGAASPAPTPATMPPLKTGDVVFQTTLGEQSTAIMYVSKSLYTHMGLIEIGKDGKPVVVEAVGPVREIPLDKWIAKGVGNRITVKRIKDLAEDDAKKAIAEARRYTGRPYDIYFYKSRDAIYCSELVHVAYKDGPHVTLGAEQKIGELPLDSKEVKKLIKQRWSKHPACLAQGKKSFEACYKIILEEPLVTPASIARDPKVELIYTNFEQGAE
jgi:hypothetical protein